jgi:ferrous iron transport protein B
MSDTLAIPARIALVGNPNCGKTALFNALTGSRQKVGNYPGVTVERKEGAFVTPGGHRVAGHIQPAGAQPGRGGNPRRGAGPAGRRDRA